MLVIAHRGSSVRAPENTLKAFAAALEDGADGIEFDVRLTADHRAVLMHDDDIARTTNGAGRVSEMTFDELRGFDAGGGERVSALEEALALIRGEVAIVAEIKGAFGGTNLIDGAAVARAVLPMIAGVPSLTVSSFDPGAIAVVRAAAADIPTAITIGGSSELDWGLQLAIEAGHAQVHVPAERVEASFVARVHESQRAVLAYTVNDAPHARELQAMGVDGIFTDDPAAIRLA